MLYSLRMQANSNRGRLMWLWCEFFRMLNMLRSSCARQKTFYWLCTIVAGLCIREDLAGLTSIVRVLGLKEVAYHSLRFSCHSSAIKLEKLTSLWLGILTRIFSVVTIDGFMVFLGDGLKVGKEGKKMPAVKKLHQASDNNSKPPYIMGHSFQAIGLLVTGMAGCLACVPVISRIHEGLVWSNRDQRTLLDKMAEMFLQIVRHGLPALLVADAYYATRKMILPLLGEGSHLVTRLRKTSVAFFPVAAPAKAKRGRPKLYGKKIRLWTLFDRVGDFLECPSPVYGEADVILRYMVIDLLWRPVGRLVRFVLVEHPIRGKIMLMSTNTAFDAIQIIKAYGYRFKIEVTFKQALRTIGAYAYHFWMKPMERLTRNSGDQYMHRRTEDYRQQVRRKIHAYHVHVMLGCIAQGVLIHFSLNYGRKVWDSFGGWLRTMKRDQAPSELVTANALRSALPEFIMDNKNDHEFKIFLRDQMDRGRAPGLRFAG
jgi:hypothetical protein